MKVIPILFLVVAFFLIGDTYSTVVYENSIGIGLICDGTLCYYEINLKPN